MYAAHLCKVVTFLLLLLHHYGKVEKKGGELVTDIIKCSVGLGCANGVP